jgi:hypothetical protein
MPMNAKGLSRLAIFWLASAGLVIVVSHQVTRYALTSELTEILAPYFLITLEEPMFSDDTGVVNDRDSIANVGTKINAVVADMIEPSWLSNARSCRVAVNRIDNVDIDPVTSTEHTLRFDIPRNKIVRPVEVGISCEYIALPYVPWIALLGAGIFLIYMRVPYPLSGGRLRWMNDLVAQGYDRHEAYRLCGNASGDGWTLSDSQRLCFDALHRPEERNFATAMRFASDARIKDLNEGRLRWLLWALHKHRNLQMAVQTALAPDVVEIDLSQGTLSIHGVDIPVNRTPLFYYAWYANQRRSADGWLTNPQANRPDRNAGTELGKLMWRCAGHAKAVSSLEEVGLRAKTLDQNRSKIKDEIVAVLGEEIGSQYLFDMRKDRDTGRMSYRLRVSAEGIAIRA